MPAAEEVAPPNSPPEPSRPGWETALRESQELLLAQFSSKLDSAQERIIQRLTIEIGACHTGAQGFGHGGKGVEANLLCIPGSRFASKEGAPNNPSPRRNSGLNPHQTSAECAPPSGRGGFRIATSSDLAAFGSAAVDKEHRAMTTYNGLVVPKSFISTGPSTTARRLVENPHFNMFLGLIVMANIIFIGIDTDIAARDARSVDDSVSGAILGVRWFFVFCFTFELALRLVAYGRRFFTMAKDRKWNMLDIVVVVSSWFEIVVEEVSGSPSFNTSQFRVLRMLRVTRILRVTRLLKVIRVLRAFQVIRALRVLICQILSTAKSMVWAVLLLLMLVFMFSIMFTQAAGAELRDAFTDYRETKEHEALREFWGNVPNSMLSLYMSVTGGISWWELYMPLRLCGPNWCFMLIVYVCIAQLAVLNVLTGVFCQNAIESAQRDEELAIQEVLANKQFYAAQLENMFKVLDCDQSGSISSKEFEDLLASSAVRAQFETMGVDSSDVQMLFRLMDDDDSNMITLEEFIDGILRMRGTAQRVDIAKLTYESKFIAHQVKDIHFGLNVILGGMALPRASYRLPTVDRQAV